MRLARYRSARAGVDGPERRVLIGLVDGDHVVPVAAAGPGGDRGQSRLLEIAMADGGAGPAAIADPEPLSAVQLLAPVPRPPSIRDFYAFEAHVATARRARGLDVDPLWYELAVFYFTNPAAVRGPGDPVWAPGGSQRLDYELEVAAVIGRETASPAASRWLDVVAGFCVMNDWSARDLQAREMRLQLGPAKGKDFATSLGPFLVTPDELPGVESGRPQATMRARVDGVEWSCGELADLRFSWGELVEQAGRDTVLRPGDVIGSGTVGTGCILELAAVHGGDRYPWLAPGSTVELEVDHLGVLANPIVARATIPAALVE